ncbi:MAG TPA: hypothetical protein VHV10_18000 [Ktedonobacteraceae bacterium]|nr:hypothetical protein [Ktedonobacteraceae bacterium]
MDNSSSAPPEYKGRIALDPILLDRALLCAWLEAGGFKLTNSRVHVNLLFHHMGGSLHETALLLREATAMVGRPYRPLSGSELHLGDLVFLEMPRQTPVDRAKDEQERRSHSDPDQADTGNAATSD